MASVSDILAKIGFSSYIEDCGFNLKEVRPVGLGLSCLSFSLFLFKAIHSEMIWPDCLQ